MQHCSSMHTTPMPRPKPAVSTPMFSGPTATPQTSRVSELTSPQHLYYYLHASPVVSSRVPAGPLAAVSGGSGSLSALHALSATVPEALTPAVLV